MQVGQILKIDGWMDGSEQRISMLSSIAADEDAFRARKPPDTELSTDVQPLSTLKRL